LYKIHNRRCVIGCSPTNCLCLDCRAVNFQLCANATRDLSRLPHFTHFLSQVYRLCVHDRVDRLSSESPARFPAEWRTAPRVEEATSADNDNFFRQADSNRLRTCLENYLKPALHEPAFRSVRFNRVHLPMSLYALLVTACLPACPLACLSVVVALAFAVLGTIYPFRSIDLRSTQVPGARGWSTPAKVRREQQSEMALESAGRFSEKRNCTFRESLLFLAF